MLLELAMGVLGFLAYNQFFDQYEANNATAYYYMAADEEAKAEWRKDKEFLMMLKLTPEMVEKWDMDGEEKMDYEKMDGEMKEDKKPMDSLMMSPPSLRTTFAF